MSTLDDLDRQRRSLSREREILAARHSRNSGRVAEVQECEVLVLG